MLRIQDSIVSPTRFSLELGFQFPVWPFVFALFVSLTGTGCAPLWYSADDSALQDGKTQQASVRPTRKPRRLEPGSIEERTIAAEIEAHREFPEVVPQYPAIQIQNSAEVNRFVNHYVTENRLFLEEALERRETYLPTMEAVFQRYGLPKELINLALIESGFQPAVRSDQGAAGMWQFMSTTARSYGLRVGRTIDDRRDVLKSTIAAARHLTDLYDAFGNWYLALAAYNMGVGGLNRAIEEGGTRDFFELSRKGRLNRETSEFVPRFLAVTKICQNTQAFGLGSDRDLTLSPRKPMSLPVEEYSLPTRTARQDTRLRKAADSS